MDSTHLMMFVIASWALILVPGPDMIYVITRGMMMGRRAGVISAAGVVLGILVHTLAAAFGLAVVLQTSALAFTVIKYAGAAYLIYLGIKAIRSKGGLLTADGRPAASLRAVFWQGTLSSVLNPKLALFFLAFLPQFVTGTESVALQMAALGLLFAFFGLLFLTVLGYFAGEVGTRLAASERFSNALRLISGTILTALGIRLVFAERT